MTKTNKKRLLIIVLCAVLMAAALFSAYVLRYHFWRIYGFIDGMRKGEKGILSQISVDTATLKSLEISELEGTEGIIYSNVLWLVNSSHPLEEGKTVKIYKWVEPAIGSRQYIMLRAIAAFARKFAHQPEKYVIFIG